jgi:hypothetical protein
MYKQAAILLFAISSSLYSVAQNFPETKGPLIKWEESTHGFGDIYQGDKVSHTFHFKNVGTSPLIITNVEVTCGCTIPKGWPRDPVLPGDKGELEVLFNSTGKMGKQLKVVTIISNAATGNSQITFSATILEKKP